MATGARESSHAEVAHARLRINRIGLWLFLLSETFLFGALISTRYFLQGLHRPEEVNQALGLAITVVLLGSSLTAYRAETAAAQGDQRAFSRNLLATVALGALFVVGMGIEWWEAYHYFPPHTGYGSVFFIMTGIHATHVLSGLIMLGLVYGLGRRPGRFGPGNFWGVEGSVKYWHFVDVAWVFIYPTLYLVR